jgi:DNA-binding transcriptional LysR family regulator
MEFQQLEVFVAVVEEGSVRRAAERVCRTAPAVSIALRKLEEEMGGPLFDRSRRYNHHLTSSGKILYSYATRILELRHEAVASVNDLIHNDQTSLRIGTHESTSLYVLPSLIHTFNEAQPGIKTEVISGSSERLLKALGNRAIELALIADAPDDPQLERNLIAGDELVLILSPKHKLAQSRHVHVRDLAGENLIVQGSKSVLRETIVNAFQETGTPFKLRVENIAIEAIKRMVVENVGIGFVPLMCVREEAANGKLVAIKLEGVRDEWNLWLVRRKEHLLSRAARAFLRVSLNAAPGLTSAEAWDGGQARAHQRDAEATPGTVTPASTHLY